MHPVSCGSHAVRIRGGVFSSGLLRMDLPNTCGKVSPHVLDAHGFGISGALHPDVFEQPESATFSTGCKWRGYQAHQPPPMGGMSVILSSVCNFC